MGEEVDANGCSASQNDSDGDGVNNDKDKCPYTPFGDPVNSDGCMYVTVDDDSSSCFIQPLIY